jgi:ubiquinone/menaquinone biosynthesis C-methylase UbiE
LFDKALEGVTGTLLDMAAVEAGQRLLDVACGAGAQTIQGAKRVGTEGIVVASDISGTMLEQVRQNAAIAGITNIQTVEGAAEDLAEEIGRASCRERV